MAKVYFDFDENSIDYPEDKREKLLSSLNVIHRKVQDVDLHLDSYLLDSLEEDDIVYFIKKIESLLSLCLDNDKGGYLLSKLLEIDKNRENYIILIDKLTNKLISVRKEINNFREL